MLIRVYRNILEYIRARDTIADRLGISANYVGRLANKLHLKQEPIWSKLGKIQLNNGKWVGQFYYNEDVVKAMEAQF